MFSQVCIIPSVHRMVCVSQHAIGQGVCKGVVVKGWDVGRGGKLLV